MAGPAIDRWIASALNERETEFRQAVHVVLHAIASAPPLRGEMVMKGGILLALQYGSSRHTRDIDFSTAKLPGAFNIEEFVEEFSQCLALAVEELDYGLDCRVQSHEMRPPRPDATQPTLKIKIGYAYKNSSKHKRLLNRLCPDVVELDYSFNEPNTDPVVFFEFEQGCSIGVYSLTDVIAEKYRALLQQETRNRVRRQDAYDLYCLIRNRESSLSPEDRRRILGSLLVKSEAREMSINRDSITHDEVVARSKREYPMLEAEIEGALPDFDSLYSVVVGFYRSLPWE